MSSPLKLRNNDQAYQWVKERKPFEGRRSAPSVWATDHFDTSRVGALPAEWVDMLIDAHWEDGIDYLVYSYETPIAWFSDGKWTVPDVSYSVTTDKWVYWLGREFGKSGEREFSDFKRKRLIQQKFCDHLRADSTVQARWDTGRGGTGQFMVWTQMDTLNYRRNWIARDPEDFGWSEWQEEYLKAERLKRESKRHPKTITFPSGETLPTVNTLHCSQRIGQWVKFLHPQDEHLILKGYVHEKDGEDIQVYGPNGRKFFTIKVWQAGLLDESLKEPELV